MNNLSPEIISLYEQLSQEIDEIRQKTKRDTLSITLLRAKSPTFRKFVNKIKWDSQQILDNAPQQLPIKKNGEGKAHPKKLEDYIPQLIEICLQKNVKQVSRAWIERNYNKLYQWVYLQAKKQNLNRDEIWEQVAKICHNNNISFKFSIHDKPKSLNERINEVITLLENENPTLWTPLWLEKNLPRNYIKFRQIFNCEHGILWSKLISLLPVKWQKNFYISLANFELFEKYPTEKALYIQGKNFKLKMDLSQRLKNEQLESFNLKWLNNNAPKIYNGILSLKKIDINFSWYEFINEIEGQWINKFEIHAQNSKDYSEKLKWTLKKNSITNWSIHWLLKNHPSIYSGIRKTLKKENKEWKDFFNILPENILQLYNEYEDSPQRRANQRYGTIDQRKQDIMIQINIFLENNKKSHWTREDILKYNPRLIYKLKKYFNGIKGIFPYLSDKFIDSFKTNSPHLNYALLAEKTRRNLLNKNEDSWRISNINNNKLKKKLKELEKKNKLILLLNHLPNNLKYGFINTGAKNNARTRINNVIQDNKNNTDIVHTIIQQTNYENTGIISWELLTQLKSEIKNGNNYAILIADSIIESHLTTKGLEIPIRRGNLAEALFKLTSPDNFEKQLEKQAYSLAYQGKNIIELDKKLSTDNNQSSTFNDFLSDNHIYKN